MMTASLIRFLNAATRKAGTRLSLLDELLRQGGGRKGRLVAEIMRRPSFAEDFVQLLSFVDPREPVFLLDVGAYHGEFTAEVLNYWKDVRVVALEPAKASFRKIQQRFKHDSRVQCLNYAASNDDRQKELLIDDNRPYLNSFHRYHDDYGVAFSASHTGIESVECRKLSSIVTLPSDRTVIVKIDVQGHEASVVSSSRRWFREVDAVLCEVSFCQEYRGVVPSFVDVAAALRDQEIYPIGFQTCGRKISNYAFERDVLFVKKSRLDRILFHRTLTTG